MLPKYTAYEIWPKIVPANKPTAMAIVPTGRVHFFFEDTEYELTVIPVNGDELNYYTTPTTHKKITVTARSGVIKFDYTFEGEQEYLLILKKDDKKVCELNLYSLNEDLYALRPLKGDLHSHSHRSDGQSDPAALAGHYREQGYDFQALTDHNRYYPGGEIDEVYNGVNLGYARVTGEEVHTPGSLIHIVHVGGKHSVAEQYIHQREKYDAEVAEYETKVPSIVPEQYKRRYAMANWACDKIHEAEGLAIFAHPYWAPGGSRVYNVNDEFSAILLKSGIFDLFELVGGMGQVGINRAIALWADLRAEGVKIPVCGSSDVHGLESEEYYPNLFTVVFAKANDNQSIIEALKNGLSVGVEAIGNEKARQYRSYGSLRLVSYANFLLKYYFTQRQRICQGEGIAMRAFAIGEADASFIEKQFEFTKNFEARYFGEKPPVLPTKDMLDFEIRWRDTHIKVGPNTKGSSVAPFPVTRQI